MNQLKTAMLLAMLSALLLIVGHSLAGRAGFLVGLILSTVVNAEVYWSSDRSVLKTHRAQAMCEEDAPGLYSIVRQLARRGGLPMPKLYLLNDEAPNAFATGRNPANGAIVVTEGLLKLLEKDELAGVLAHELSHIQRGDTLIMTVTAMLAGALSAVARVARRKSSADGKDDGFFSSMLWLLIAPLQATLIQMTISRTREFLADESGARLTGDPLPLARALAKIEYAGSGVALGSARCATAHLFISNPVSRGRLVRFFQTHPPAAVRIERLEAMTLRTATEFI